MIDWSVIDRLQNTGIVYEVSGYDEENDAGACLIEARKLLVQARDEYQHNLYMALDDTVRAMALLRFPGKEFPNIGELRREIKHIKMALWSAIQGGKNL